MMVFSRELYDLVTETLRDMKDRATREKIDIVEKVVDWFRDYMKETEKQILGKYDGQIFKQLVISPDYPPLNLIIDAKAKTIRVKNDFVDFTIDSDTIVIPIMNHKIKNTPTPEAILKAVWDYLVGKEIDIMGFTFYFGNQHYVFKTGDWVVNTGGKFGLSFSPASLNSQAKSDPLFKTLEAHIKQYQVLINGVKENYSGFVKFVDDEIVKAIDQKDKVFAPLIFETRARKEAMISQIKTMVNSHPYYKELVL